MRLADNRNEQEHVHGRKGVKSGQRSAGGAEGKEGEDDVTSVTCAGVIGQSINCQVSIKQAAVIHAVISVISFIQFLTLTLTDTD